MDPSGKPGVQNTLKHLIGVPYGCLHSNFEKSRFNRLDSSKWLYIINLQDKKTIDPKSKPFIMTPCLSRVQDKTATSTERNGKNIGPNFFLNGLSLYTDYRILC